MLDRSCRVGLLLGLSFLLWPALSVCQPQAHSVLCTAGNRNFDAEFRTGVRVHI
jgi:hypothetical protein